MHFQRPQLGRFGCSNTLEQFFLAVVVHQETHRTQFHAEHRLAECAMPMQGLQHEAVTAQRAEHVGLVRLECAMQMSLIHI